MRTLRLARVLLLLALLPCAPLGPCHAQSSSRWSGSSGRPLIIDFLDVGQGDSILIRSPEGKTALIDAGPSKDAATNALKRKNIESIDIVIVTHHHSDHYGGMDQVIRNFKPRYFMATGSTHTTKMYLKLLQTVKDEGVTAVQPTAKPRKIELGTVLLTVLPQPPEAPNEENNNSIGVRVQYGEFATIMTGDSEEDERRVVDGPQPRAPPRLHGPQARPSRQPQRHRPALARSAPARGHRGQPGHGERLRPSPLRDPLIAPAERSALPPHRSARNNYGPFRRTDLEPRQATARAAAASGRRRGRGHDFGQRRHGKPPLLVLAITQPAEMRHPRYFERLWCRFDSTGPTEKASSHVNSQRISGEAAIREVHSSSELTHICPVLLLIRDGREDSGVLRPPPAARA